VRQGTLFGITSKSTAALNERAAPWLLQARPIVMLDEDHQFQPLSNLTGLKFIFMPIPKSSTTSRFGMMAHAESGKEPMQVENLSFEFFDRIARCRLRSINAG
jgi:hypothetical protein